MARGFTLRASRSSLLICCLATAPAVLIASPAGKAWAQAADVRTINITLPIGVFEQEIAVGASAGVTLESGAQVTGGVLLNMGPNPTIVSEGSRADQVVSVGPAEIGGTVTGDVRSEGAVSLRNQGSVGGSQQTSTPLGRRTATLPDLVIPATSAAGVVLPQGQSQPLTPGRYASLTIQPGAEVRLGGGDYFFDGAVIVEPGGVSPSTTPLARSGG